MQKWGALPKEIIDIIIFYVDENDNLQERMDDLSQCALTCRNWREIAQPVLFSKITVKEFEKASENLCHLMMNNDRLGAYVKELKSDSDMPKATSLITMDSLFPNLDKIELNWWNDGGLLLFYRLITKEGRFRNLISIPFLTRCNIDLYDYYVECLFTLKHRITKVFLLANDNEEEKPYAYLNMCNKLYQFPKLQSVYVYQRLTLSQNIMDYVESITAQEDKLTHLEKIEIELKNDDCLPLPLEKIHTIQSSTKIKDINASMYSSSEEQFVILLYIMKKFPSLRRIQLSFNSPLHSMGNDFLTQEYTTATLQSLQYLCQIRDCHVSDIFALENPGSLIRDLLLQVKIKPPRILITCVKTHALFRRSRRFIKAFINVKKDVIDSKYTISVKFKKEAVAEFELLHLNLFQEAGRLFTDLTLETDTDDELISGIDYIAKYCHQLEKLEIRAKYLPDDSLTVLETMPDGAKNYSVKELRVSDSELTLKQITFISAQFQCLENLIIDNFLVALWCRQFVTTVDGNQTLSICLNNRSLKYVNIKTDGNVMLSGLNGIHINVTTDAGQKSHVSLSTEKQAPATEDSFQYCFVPLRGYNKQLSSTKDEKWITYHIHCKCIEKLDVVFPTTVTKYGKERESLQTHTLLF